jgi:hypothetical protein
MATAIIKLAGYASFDTDGTIFRPYLAKER